MTPNFKRVRGLISTYENVAPSQTRFREGVSSDPHAHLALVSTLADETGRVITESAATLQPSEPHTSLEERPQALKKPMEQRDPFPNTNGRKFTARF
jgi:hypothetical protein